jgi:hypothetical protein
MCGYSYPASYGGVYEMKRVYKDTKTGLIVTVGIVLSQITVELLPLRATSTGNCSVHYDITVGEFLSERFYELKGA